MALADRRRFTAEYKQRILAKVDAGKRSGGIGALLRRKGLYSSLVTTWRREQEAKALLALTPRKRGPKPFRDPIADNNRRTAQSRHRYRRSKKVAALLGRPTPTAGPTDPRAGVLAVLNSERFQDCGLTVAARKSGQLALDAAYLAHPERFVRGVPTPPPLPTEVWIKKPQSSGENTQ